MTEASLGARSSTMLSSSAAGDVKRCCVMGVGAPDALLLLTCYAVNLP